MAPRRGKPGTLWGGPMPTKADYLAKALKVLGTKRAYMEQWAHDAQVDAVVDHLAEAYEAGLEAGHEEARLEAATAYEEGEVAERERCLAWLQHAREEGEVDMRQVRAWVRSGGQPPGEE